MRRVPTGEDKVDSDLTLTLIIRVLARVTATITKPRDDRPYEGFLLINSEISPMASSVYEAGRSSDDEVVITRLLEKSIRRTEAVDREALCIIAGEKVSPCVVDAERQVWHLRLTLHFLSDSGNLLDCAALAAMASLKHFRKPDVEVLGDEVIIVSLFPPLKRPKVDGSTRPTREPLSPLPFTIPLSASHSHTLSSTSPGSRLC